MSPTETYTLSLHDALPILKIMRKEKELAEKKSQESQELALQNLQKADELKDEFLAITSHELRTPLYGMIGRSEEHTSELQSRGQLVCRLLLEKKKNKQIN